MTVADQLRTWRRRWRLTQSQAAAALGVKLATLQNWEQARFRPEGLTLESLLLKLQSPPES